MARRHHKKTKTYKNIVKYLRYQARTVKVKMQEKYSKKIKHLEDRYKEDEEEQLKAPAGMNKYNHLSVFSEKRYEEIEEDDIKVPVIGKTDITGDRNGKSLQFDEDGVEE